MLRGPCGSQVTTVFLGSFLGGTLLNQLQQWLQNPESALTILGTAAPLTAIFFTQYIMLQVPHLPLTQSANL
jgi:hypothetical protein